MAKPLKEIIREITNETELKNTLIDLSVNEGGAWVFSVKPFSHTVTFSQFKNPSSVPDHFSDATKNTMAHNGKIRGFTKAAKVREQNRGLGAR